MFCCSGMSGAEKARVKQLAKNLSKYLSVLIPRDINCNR